MTMSEHQLRAQLSEIRLQPSGPARFAAYDALFRHADAIGATRFAFDTRLAALSEFHHGGDPTRAFLAFSWCLTTADRHPELVQPHNQHQLLWRFKWMVWALPQFPDIPLDRTAAVLDDMERRYQIGGYGPHAVYQHRWLVAHHIGDRSGAERWYNRMVSATRDGMSDCRACVPSSQVRHLSSIGAHDEAIRVGEPFKRGGCSEQPQWMLAELLLPYLASGRLDEAVDAHRVGYRRIRDDRHHLDNVAAHLNFCGRSGNEAAGLTIVEHHLSWLDRPSSPFAEMEFAAAAALVLGRLRDAGRGKLAISRRSDDGMRRWRSTVGEVHDELVGRVTALAARFDARNGNTYQSERVAAVMSAPPLMDRLPLTVLAGRVSLGAKPGPRIAELVERVAELTATGDPAGAAKARLDVAYALRNADRWSDAAEAAEEAVRSLDRAGLTEDTVRCRYLLFELYQRSREHRSQALAAVDAIGVAAAIPDDLPPYEALLEQAAGLTHGAEKAKRLLAAGERYRAAGRVADEFRTLTRALATPGSHGPDDAYREAFARAELLARTQAGLPAGERGHFHLIAADVAEAGDRIDEALQQIEGAISCFERADLTREWLRTHMRRAQLLLMAGRAAEAETQARELFGSEIPDVTWAAGLVAVKALQDQGLNDEARALMDELGLEDSDLNGDDD
jgi:tetratricopeptide (TPR) repeat protein